MRTTKQRELNQITNRIEAMISKDATWVYDLVAYDFGAMKNKNTSFENILECLKYNNGAMFKSYSMISNRILIGKTLYQF